MGVVEWAGCRGVWFCWCREFVCRSVGKGWPQGRRPVWRHGGGAAGRQWNPAPPSRHAAPPGTGRDDATVALVLAAREKSTPAGAVSTSVVLADSPGFQRRFLPVGVRVIPPWSPQADWLFDLTLPAAEAVRRWGESGVRYLVITKWQTHLDFFNRHSRWNRAPFEVQLVGETPSTAVFSIRAVD